MAPPSPLALNYRRSWLGGRRGTAMIFLMSVGLFSLGASFGFVMAGVFNNGDLEAPQKVRSR